jgi:hypothetical protein
VSAAIFTAMHNTPHNPYRRWDGSRTATRPRRPLSLTPGAGSRLLRCGQIGCCRDCGNAVEWYYRPDHRPVPLHPRELPAPAVPEESRWHVSSGIAYPAGDGSAWCRLPHAALCPARDPRPPMPQLSGLRRRMAAHTRRMIDTGAFTPTPAPAGEHTRCRPARPVVQILGIRYLAARPVEDIHCLARASTTRARCTQTLADPALPPGTWRLLPATATTGQLALPADLVMAVYDLSALPYSEQLRWPALPAPRVRQRGDGPDRLGAVRPAHPPRPHPHPAARPGPPPPPGRPPPAHLTTP